MRDIEHLVVKYHDRIVGELAETKDGFVAFQYDKDWVADGFAISPFSLPLDNKVYVPKKDVFEGAFGVFADSLPDGWGRLLVDRMLMSMNISPRTVSTIQRLAIVGNTGMGALEYYPQWREPESQSVLDFDRIALECEKILSEKNSDDLDVLFQMGGSSGGARPKVLVNIEDEPWIVKFPSSDDKKSIGAEEYQYMLCAKECGIVVPEVRLFPSKAGEGYFGAKRFDRVDGKKVHMMTVSALLETSHRVPNLDYHDLMKLTFILTKDNQQMEQMYRRMCFNVYAHNRDDHSKNFSYMYDEEQGRWLLMPAYDLTYSYSVGGEHATCVNGNGWNPGLEDLIEVGKATGLSVERLKSIALEIEGIVQERLKKYISKL